MPTAQTSSVGTHDDVLRNTGNGWGESRANVPVVVFLQDIHGSASDDVWVAATSYYLHFDGSSWTRTNWDFVGLKPSRVWAFGPNDAWMTSLRYSLHWDGASWTEAVAPSVRDINGVWGSDSSNVFAYGDDGTISSWDGAQWVLQAPAATAPQHLGRTWVESPSSLWVVGDYGTIRHWDGESWTEHESGTLAQLFAIDGNSAGEIWVGGEAGTLLHYDGEQWSPEGSGTGENIGGLWVAESGDVYAAIGTLALPATVYNGAVLHRAPSGGEWVYEATPNISTLLDIWGSAADDIWAVGHGVVLHYDGGRWREYELPSGLAGTLFLSIWGRSGDEVWTVGRGGTIIHWNGNSWQQQATPADNTLLAVGGNADSVWAVGEEGTIFRLQSR